MLAAESRESIFSSIDLLSVMKKLQQEINCSNSLAISVEKRYRGFLYLNAIYPNEILVPSCLLDKVWHLHILYTRQYMSDCNIMFGKYLHHLPMEGAETEHNLNFEKTKKLFKKEFGYSLELPDNIEALPEDDKQSCLESRQAAECDSDINMGS